MRGQVPVAGGSEPASLDGAAVLRWYRPVAEYDAFGRKIGEDPLEGLGWKAGGAAAPPAEAAGHAAPARAAEAAAPAAPEAAAPAAEPAAPPAARPVFVRRRPRGRRPARGLARVLLVAGAAGALALYAGDASQEIRDSMPAAPEATLRARPPAGLQDGSLIRRASFGTAVARLRSAGLGRLTLLRVAPARIDARLLTRGGRLRNVQLRHDGELRDFGASAGGFGFVDTIPFSRVDLAAPERLARAASRRLGVLPARVDYLVLTTAGWSVVFEGGRQFAADRAGRHLRRIS
jgi:pyruvate/2-oxoglutarate dehydrogenase complex dihydrolipoamide acyltransferase (E2) component